MRKDHEILFSILESIRKWESLGEKVTFNYLKSELLNLKCGDQKELKNVNTINLAQKAMEIKKAITFLERRLSSIGIFNNEIIVEKAKEISDFDHQTLSLAVQFLYQERKKQQKYNNITAFPTPFQKNRRPLKAVPKSGS